MTRPRRSNGAVALSKGVRAALQQLLEARENAQRTNRDVWDFAVEMDYLQDVGLTSHGLRWLVQQGYVEHAEETTSATDNQRTFGPTGALTFPPRTCVVLTESGVRLARQLRGERPSNGHGSARTKRQRPCYDAERRLRVGKTVMHRFTRPAPCQEALPRAFETAGWQYSIDNPLPRVSGKSSKKRLHDTIQDLNRNLKPALIKFHGDGTGMRVYWEWES